MEKPMQFEQRPDDVGGQNTEQTESIESGLSFEWGPEFGKMSWTDAHKKMIELNKTVKEGEELWRLPTIREWEEVFKPLEHFKIGYKYEPGTYYGDGEQGEPSVTYHKKEYEDEEIKRVLGQILKNNNLKENENYWSRMDTDDIEKEEEIQAAANAKMPAGLETLLEKIKWEEENLPTDHLYGPFIFSTNDSSYSVSEDENHILRVVRAKI